MTSQGARGKTRSRTIQATHFSANPQQAAAIGHNTGPAAFIAAAGTGKTSILVQRLARLVADEGVAPNPFSVLRLLVLPPMKWKSVLLRP